MTQVSFSRNFNFYGHSNVSRLFLQWTVLVDGLVDTFLKTKETQWRVQQASVAVQLFHLIEPHVTWVAGVVAGRVCSSQMRSSLRSRCGFHHWSAAFRQGRREQ